MGKATGVITTDLITGATPASFYAHVDSRTKAAEIGAQLVASKVTVAMGGGGRNLAATARANGFQVVTDARGMTAASGSRLLGLYGGSLPSLRQMMDKSLTTLAMDPQGFFLIAESSEPDGGGHQNNLALVRKGVTALDNALQSALTFARRDGETLVVVTSDHETGGLSVQDRAGDAPRPTWTTTGHTGNMVAIYAFGPGAEKFTGTHDNTELPKLFAAFWGRTLGK
jgi:alkaline phosphatase